MKKGFLKCMGLAMVSLVIPFCASCNKKDDSGKIKIVTSIYPEYDWVMTVLGDKKDNASVTMLRDNGVDIHSYTPSFEDTKNISECDLLVYVGGESDDWIDDTLKDALNKDMKVINLLDTLGDAAKEEEVVEGMQGEEEGEEEEEEEVEYDEHVWLSVRNAQLFVKTISETLSEIDETNANYYKANAETYINQLKDLDNRYVQAVAEGSKNTLVFADRFPFRYMVEDYSLKYHAAFLGCAAVSDIDFTTIKFLADKVNELELNVILKIEGKTGESFANSVKETAKRKDLKVLTMDSIQSAKSSNFKSGKTYLSIMEDNLNVLKEALQ